MSIDEINEILQELNNVRPEALNENARRLFNAIMQIADERDKYIDLYNKEKLNSLNLSEQLKKEKEKNKWKPISEYNNQKYDWVLVKYFDGNYECVPEVAEKRNDGKWYTSEREIPFEVKYFFDMQLLEE